MYAVKEKPRCTWECHWVRCTHQWHWDWRGAWWWYGQPCLPHQQGYPQSVETHAHKKIMMYEDHKHYSKLSKGLCTIYSPTWAPSSCTSLQDSGNTSVAITGYPCFSKFFAIGFPILPKPINPTWVFEAMDLEDTTKQWPNVSILRHVIQIMDIKDK